jgi:hypothetical protein
MSMLAPLRALVTVTVLLAFASAPAMARTIPTILIWQPDHTASESGEALLADLVVLGEDAALSDDLFAYSTDLSGHAHSRRTSRTAGFSCWREGTALITIPT